MKNKQKIYRITFRVDFKMIKERKPIRLITKRIGF